MIDKSVIALGSIMPQRSGSVNPDQFPGEVFDLYSIPAYDNGVPERLPASSIGSVKQLVQEGDVLLSKIVPHIRRCWVVGPAKGKRQIASGEWIIFRSTDVDTGFLRNFLLSDSFHDQFMKTVSGVGGSLLRARPSEVAKICLTMPDRDDQQRIAARLDTSDSIRARRREAIKLADVFLRSVFFDMFGEPTTNPKGLSKENLGNLIKLKSGNFLPSHEMAGGGDVPVYGGNGINGHHDQYMFAERKIVIGRVGAYCGSVHVTAEKNWITDNALYVAEKSKAIHTDYLAFALRFANLNQYASQSGQPLVSGSRIYPVEILLPDEPGQLKFESILRKTEQMAIRQQLSVAGADQLFYSLQQQAFS